MKRRLGLWGVFIAAVVGIAALAVLHPAPSYAADDPDGDGLIGCGEGTGLFSLFQGDVERAEIRAQRVGTEGSLLSFSMAELDLAGLTIAPGDYRVFAVSADEHWNNRRANDASTFESFYVQFGNSGPVAPRPTPDLGPGYDTRYNWPGLAQEDFNQFSDFLGSNGGIVDPDSNLNTVPSRFDENIPGFDKGADLGVVTLNGSFNSRINFVHYFSDNTSTGFNQGIANRQHYRNGFLNGTGPLAAIRGLPSWQKGDDVFRDFAPFMHPNQIFTHNANSTNIGIIRIECASPPPAPTPTPLPPPSPTQFDIGCSQGSGLFDLFSVQSSPLIYDKIYSYVRTGQSNEIVVNQIRAVDPIDGVVKDVRITPGQYEVFAVGSDDHFDSIGSSTEDQPFETFFVEIDGQRTPRPTPDYGLIGSGSKSSRGINFTGAGYSLSDYQLAASNNGDFDSRTDYIGRGKYNDPDRSFPSNPSESATDRIPDELINRGNANFDKGASLGSITIGSVASSVTFKHFFHPDYGNMSGQAAAPVNPSGQKFSSLLANRANTSHVGIIRLECQETRDYNIEPDVSASVGDDSLVAPGETFTVEYRFCNIGELSLATGRSSGFTTHTLNGTSVSTNTLFPILSNTDLAQDSLQNSANSGDCVRRDYSVTVPATATPGDRYCVTAVATNPTSAGGSALSSPYCVRVSVTASFRVTGGDLLTLGGIRTARSSVSGSYGQYRVQANGLIENTLDTGFGSQGSVTNSTLTFSNDATAKGNFASSGTFPNHFIEFSVLASGVQETASTLSNARLTSFTQNYVAFRPTTNLLRIGSISGYEGQIVLLVDGDVRIDGNITLNGIGVSVNQLPVITIIASGNISIAPGVSTVQANLLAGANLDTCIGFPTADCSRSLTIQGVTAAAGTISFNRASPVGFSETFNKPAYLDLINLESLNGGAPDIVITQFRDLPPIIR